MELSKSLLTAKKIAAVIIDLDETLWKGTIVQNEKLELNLDRWGVIKDIYKRGIQIFIASKNDKDEVIRTLESLGIDRDIFTHIMANWESKVKNISELLAATDILPQTAVFVDDDQINRDMVKAAFPKMHILEPEQMLFLAGIPAIDSRSLESSSEIKNRQNRYRAKIAARPLMGRGVLSYDFELSLRKEVCVDIPPVNSLYRIAKLLFTTHRLNFNPPIVNDEEMLLEKIFNKINSGRTVYAVSASQQGNSLGMIGAFIINFNDKVATIENATFSCSSMGLGFEERALAILMGKLKQQGINRVFLYLSDSSTNDRIQKLLWRFGFEALSNNQHDKCLVFNKFISRFNAEKWLPLIKETNQLNLNYPGMPEVIKFFDSQVSPLINAGDSIVNLGSARGEVLGLLENERRQEFMDAVAEAKILNVDLEYVPEIDNIVADAENLSTLFADESQNQVWAVELLEHTRHPWKVISEMARICQVGGYIFISIPGKSFPKHEYPVDFWRIGPNTLVRIFSSDYFKLIALENVGSPDNLRRTMVVFQKIKATPSPLASAFVGGQLNENNGITYFD